MQDTNLYIKSILAYIITFQFYRLLYNLESFFLIDFNSNLFTWLLLSIAVALSLLIFRIISKAIIEGKRLGNLYFLYVLLAGITITDGIFIVRIAEYVAGNIDDIYVLLYFTKVEAWFFIGMNTVIVLLYKPLIR